MFVTESPGTWKGENSNGTIQGTVFDFGSERGGGKSYCRGVTEHFPAPESALLGRTCARRQARRRNGSAAARGRDGEDRFRSLLRSGPAAATVAHGSGWDSDVPAVFVPKPVTLVTRRSGSRAGILTSFPFPGRGCYTMSATARR